MDSAIKQMLEELKDRTMLNQNWEQVSWRLVKMMDICKRIQDKYPHIWQECVTREEIKEIFGLK